jgi:hypothetical protein
VCCVAGGLVALSLLLGSTPVIAEDLPAVAVALPEQEEEAAVPEIDNLTIVFEGHTGSAEEAQGLPERYNPLRALFTHEDWEPLGFCVVDATGYEAVPYRTDPTLSIDFSALELAPGEYHLEWRARSGEHTIATLTRSFVVGF